MFDGTYNIHWMHVVIFESPWKIIVWSTPNYGVVMIIKGWNDGDTVRNKSIFQQKFSIFKLYVVICRS